MTGVPPLTVFTPLPPARNGIADYAALLLGALHGEHYHCAAAVEAWEATPPPAPGIAVLDHALAHRRAGRVLHQLGNNAQHGFVLRALRRAPGVTTLHDPGLLHLHEVAGEGQAAILAGMAAAPAPLGPVFARQLRDDGVSSRANHALFDLGAEVLARSRAVIVHSRFAAARLRALHGAARTGHVAVVPHLLPPRPMPAREAARAALGIAPGQFLVVTAGFATRAKRFDWLRAALEALDEQGTAFRWVHAGEARPEEVDLSRLGAHGTVTGWLDEAALDAHIAAADVLVNLRFPSFGESSGALARAFAAGTAAIVTDTAAYAELPREAVLHIPPLGAAQALAAALAGLAGAPELARSIGAAGRRFAASTMALPAIAAAHAAIIEESLGRPVAPMATPASEASLCIAAPDAASVRRALAGVAGRCRLFLGAADGAAPEQVPPLAALLPPEAALRGLRVQLPPAAPGLLLELELPGWRP